MPIPQITKEAIGGYVEKGVAPGHFVTKVLENDLFGAIGHADATNLKHISDIVKYVYCQTPSGCWGSKKKVDEWLKAKMEEFHVQHDCGGKENATATRDS